MTLRDAGEHIAALPKAMHGRPELAGGNGGAFLVAEKGGPTVRARVGVMRALNRKNQVSMTGWRFRPCKLVTK
ncbi:hypothetical protein GCM10007857_79530 [Bradyrhizobium iriomotense]|uniref:Uncharacterized protein n=1 Tax=Bradyrhizobium iriomotense TaxID=441950 RepID=A0ABQ6BF50_9BRAD|nr:hypothetical protein GCM10007857_79530 [Bradyrhizobium iriomotense]